jgi:hypothetical protein
MTTLDQKRMLKLAGLLKEGVEEWIDEEENVAPTSLEDEEEEFERMPKQMGMGRGAGLEETYIDNMKEAIRAIVREVLLEKIKKED